MLPPGLTFQFSLVVLHFVIKFAEPNGILAVLIEIFVRFVALAFMTPPGLADGMFGFSLHVLSARNVRVKPQSFRFLEPE
jgi:hypothetical protein